MCDLHVSEGHHIPRESVQRAWIPIQVPSSRSFLPTLTFHSRGLIKQFSQRPFSPKASCVNTFFFPSTQLHVCLETSFELARAFPSLPPPTPVTKTGYFLVGPPQKAECAADIQWIFQLQVTVQKTKGPHLIHHYLILPTGAICLHYIFKLLVPEIQFSY